METKVKGKYCYKVIRDSGVTGRFEVLKYNSQADMDSGSNGEVIWSKAKSGSLPFNDKGYADLLNKLA